jgi:hypothetical protein
MYGVSIIEALIQGNLTNPVAAEERICLTRKGCSGLSIDCSGRIGVSIALQNRDRFSLACAVNP